MALLEKSWPAQDWNPRPSYLGWNKLERSCAVFSFYQSPTTRESISKVATTLMDFSFMGLSHVKQIYSQPISLIRELIMCIPIKRGRVDFSGDSSTGPCCLQIGKKLICWKTQPLFGILTFFCFEKPQNRTRKFHPRCTKLLIGSDRMMPQKSYRHIWKAES